MVVQRRDGPRRLREIDDDEPSFPACGFVPVGIKNNNNNNKFERVAFLSSG